MKIFIKSNNADCPLGILPKKTSEIAVVRNFLPTFSRKGNFGEIEK